ncbi:family 43 glycosylhydrolase [Microbulbifer sp. YPW1]|uniref:family 43 glycosylhydrolase n=1 Tax=Microbulbifer sp. YPW1 TaxID=2745199 RepID=UPI00159B4AB2|nr:family 43 glycosylhydrolase [Microbulbifer sp. YPW1]QKX16112.1 family 43 glycosylhydrolase [Microbulbifer sp. YPW1]
MPSKLLFSLTRFTPKGLIPKSIAAGVALAALTACQPSVDDSDKSAAKTEGKSASTAPVTQPAQVDTQAGAPEGMFANPLFANGADPWLEYWDGNYYLTTTTWTSQLVMRKSPTLDGLATAAPVNIWSDTDPARCCNFWAFEFHRLNGPNGWRWYLMYTSGQHGTLDHQHLSVLESVGDDPMGPYVYKGSPMPNSWNIDGSYLEHNGELYLLWSEWVGDEQLNWISKMTNPWSIEGPRVVITRPEEEWAQSGRKVNEGAEILKKDGRTFMIYSASYCETPDYKLAMKELTGDDPMNPDHWTKYPEPVFQRGNGVFGPGHNGFFKSPDGTEDWIVYHGNSKETDGCSATRSVRAQKFTWSDDGTPNFGVPVPEGEFQKLPSGENGPITTKVQGARWKLANAANNQCLTGAGTGACESSDSEWVLDNTADGAYRLANAASGNFLNASSELAPWTNTEAERWTLDQDENGWVQLRNRETGEPLAAKDCSGDGCAQWSLQPAEQVAIASVQSGRVLQTTGCASGAEISQGAWQGESCQRWSIAPAEEGFVQIQTGDQCMTIADNAVVPGAPAVLGNCEGASSQWRLQPLADGNLQIQNRESKHNLDLAHCGLAEGNTFAQAPAADNECQKFQLREVPVQG